MIPPGGEPVQRYTCLVGGNALMELIAAAVKPVYKSFKPMAEAEKRFFKETSCNDRNDECAAKKDTSVQV